MPFHGGEIRIDLACGVGDDGHWRGWYSVRIEPEALRRLGLHPDQPTSKITGPPRPAWWHAAAERDVR